MNISLNPAVSTNMYNNTNVQRTNKSNVQFTGVKGDQLLKQGVEKLNVADVMKEVKGTFGLKAGSVEDIMESFIRHIQELTSRNSSLEKDLSSANRTIAEFPQREQKAATEAAEEQIRRYTQILENKDKQILAKEQELKEANAVVEKYKPAFSVKPVEEVGVIMPEKAVEIIHEMGENRVAANKSMFEFLMTGKGQEDAMAQIERNNTLMKAHRDGIMDIPTVDKEYKKLSKEQFVYCSIDSNFTLNLIETSLKSNSNGINLKSRAIKEQVKKNAMAVLTPMADERYSNTGLKAIESSLDKTLDNVVKFHENVEKGLAKYKNDYKNEKDFKINIERVENDINNSKAIFSYTHNGKPHNFTSTFEELAGRGSVSW